MSKRTHKSNKLDELYAEKLHQIKRPSKKFDCASAPKIPRFKSNRLPAVGVVEGWRMGKPLRYELEKGLGYYRSSKLTRC